MVMDMAQRVASSIVDKPSCEEAKKWAAERMSFARNLRKTSWLANIRDIWHKKHDETCKLINQFATPHEQAVARVVDPAIRIWLNAEQERQNQIERARYLEQVKKDEDARLARAEELAKQGKTAQADHVLSKPPAVTAPKMEPVKMPGMSVRKTWKVRPIEQETLIELIKGIAGGAVPVQAIEVNYAWLNKQAHLMDGNLKYPGVECYQEESSTYRRTA